MKVIFASDWRDGVPYQRLLAESLQQRGITVEFLSNYKRFLPLSRLLAAKGGCDILHLHWPEAFYPRKGDAFDLFRTARFRMDLLLATRNCALAATAHNLHAHNRAKEPFAAENTAAVHHRSDVTFVHSEAARDALVKRFGTPLDRLQVIPHGDLSVVHGTPLPQEAARQVVGLSDLAPWRPVVLIFGAVEPYKGQEEVIAWWKTHRPQALFAIVGKPITPDYGRSLLATVGDDPSIHCELGWLTDERLSAWLSAVDATLFNYREIFTSGAAPLARSWGLPVLIPERLTTVVLDEPSRFVHRFPALDNSFSAILERALSTPPSYADSVAWREASRWDRVAELTVAAYERALSHCPRIRAASSPIITPR